MYYRTTTEILVWETPWAELPMYAAQQLSENERLVYQEGAAYFKRTANELGEPALVALFRGLDDDHPMRV